MSYIYCFNVNNYEPGDSLKNLYEKLITQPIAENQLAITENFKNIGTEKSKYLREVILERGRTDFDESYENYSPIDKVLLYCAFYMPMHLFSSFHIFSTKLLPSIRNDCVFVDFGCGPLTSGIAFWALTRDYNITYIGIEKSATMRKMAEKINQYGPYIIRNEPFFRDAYFISDYIIELPELLSEIIDDSMILFNFSHFLQSNTFKDSSNIETLGTLLANLSMIYGRNKITMVYQDPPHNEFQRRWYNLKSWIITYPSIFNESGFGWQDSTKKTILGYKDFWGVSTPRSVSYDSFNNFSYLENQ